MGKRKTSFPPVACQDAAILILGSMPGERSLKEQQYYAHPHNLFWPFIQDIFGIDRALPYPERLQQLQHHRIALWDVMQHCERHGSLDSNIKNEVPNDFATFFLRHPNITQIGLNGQKAFHTFSRCVLVQHPELKERCTVLPSTSPANASISRTAKLAKWRAFFAFQDKSGCK